MLSSVSMAPTCRTASSNPSCPNVRFDAWRAFAQAHGLDFTPSPLQVSGTLEGATLSAHTVPRGDGIYGVEIGLRFERRLPWYLHVRPAHFADVFERTGGASHAVAISPRFDRELRVATTDDARTRALLDDHVQEALLGLHADEGHLLLDSAGLSVQTTGMSDASTFTSVIERIAMVASTLHDLVFAAPDVGHPYRE